MTITVWVNESLLALNFLKGVGCPNLKTDSLSTTPRVEKINFDAYPHSHLQQSHEHIFFFKVDVRFLSNNWVRIHHTFLSTMVSLSLRCIGIRWTSVKLQNCYVGLKISHCLHMGKS